LASGGVGSLQDLEDLAALGASDAHKAMAGVIVGRALLEGLFTIEEAKQRCR
ncbi:MAG: HisA/HisF-related TIM barrel protein, partial [Actinobacteria bacterium]|nr:HisA/HisF-related TIM barrel protein [Actinomycetota bacterium]